MNPVRRITAPTKTGQTPRKEGCASVRPVADRDRDRDKIREVVRNHGLIVFRMGQNAAGANELGRELPAYEKSSMEGSDKQSASGRPCLDGGSWPS